MLRLLIASVLQVRLLNECNQNLNVADPFNRNQSWCQHLQTINSNEAVCAEYFCSVLVSKVASFSLIHSCPESPSLSAHIISSFYIYDAANAPVTLEFALLMFRRSRVKAAKLNK